MRNMSVLQHRLRNMQYRAQAASEKALSLAAGNTLQSALYHVPVRTGRLKASLQVKRRGHAHIVHTPCPYALYVEKGTRRMSPQPYLGPAFQQGADRERIQQIFREVLG